MLKQKRKLVIGLSFLLIVGFLLTSLSSYFISINSLHDQVANNELPLTSDNIYSEIQRDLLQPVFISSLMASDTFLRDWVLRGEKDVSEVTRYLKEIKERYNAFTTFFVSDKTHNYYQTDGLMKQVSPDEQRDVWYFRVRDMRQPYEINVDIDMANDDALTVFVNYKVFDYSGRFIGATGVGLSVDSVVQLIQRYNETYDRDILFVDGQGNVKLSSTNATTDLTPLKQTLKAGDLMKQIRSKESYSLDFNAGDKQLLVNTRFIEEFHWHLLVVQSELKGSQALLNTLLINLAVCALITLIVLFLTNRTISSYQSDIERLASIDKLTGFYNRQAFDMFFRQTLKDLSRRPKDLSVLLLDVDHFKQINDSYGHLTGDQVLRHLAQVVKDRVRETDIVARWGGEEFIVLLKNCSLETAKNMAEELRLAVMNNPCLDTRSQREIELSVSIGVVKYHASENETQVFNRADQALYRAKELGRNQVVVLENESNR